MIPLQVIDSFLLQYNVGQALLLLFILSTVGVISLKSQKIIAINTTLFGVIFMLTPQSEVPVHYLFLGVVLVLIGPLLYTTANE